LLVTTFWHHEREWPFPDDMIVWMVERSGTAMDQCASPEWAGTDLEELRPIILRVATTALTDKALTIFAAWFNGTPVTQIATSLGVSHQVVSKSLHGLKAPSGNNVGGSIRKLKNALLADTEFTEAINIMKPTKKKTPPASDVVISWYHSLLRPPRPERFVAWSVLLVAHFLADEKRNVTYRQLFEHLPQAAVNAAIPLLKALRMVQSDGVVITLVATPHDDMLAALEHEATEVRP
jgi:hypothetical protein